MEDEADGVVEPLVVTEGVVAALVGDDPNAGESAALESPVEGPCKDCEGARKEAEICGDVIEEEN